MQVVRIDPVVIGLDRGFIVDDQGQMHEEEADGLGWAGKRMEMDLMRF